MNQCQNTFWGCLIHVICWAIWKERNKRIFEGASRSHLEVREMIVREVGSWLFVLEEFKGMSLSKFTRDWVECLAHDPNMGMQPSLSEQPSFVGLVTLDFDGASKGNPRLAVYGCLTRDRERNVMISVAGLHDECDSIK